MGSAMKQKKRIIALAAVWAMFLTLAVRLINIQLHNGQEYYIKSQEGKIKVLRLAVPRHHYRPERDTARIRSEILQCRIRQGSSEGKSTYPKYTESIRKTIALLEKNGIKINANFAIRKSADGSMEFYWSGVTGEAAAARKQNGGRTCMSMRIRPKHCSRSSSRVRDTGHNPTRGHKILGVAGCAADPVYDYNRHDRGKMWTSIP